MTGTRALLIGDGATIVSPDELFVNVPSLVTVAVVFVPMLPTLTETDFVIVPWALPPGIVTVWLAGEYVPLKPRGLLL